MSLRKLSICIATYNRSDLLLRLLESVEKDTLGEVSFIIVDDGSADDTKTVVDVWARRTGADVRYNWQENSGRASALRASLLAADTPFLVIMDSDDYFLPGGVGAILAALPLLDSPPTGGRDLCGLLMGVTLSQGMERVQSLPPEVERSNFIAVRADYGIRTDLKEIVRTDMVRRHVYDVPPGCRRVPTSQLWSRLGDLYDCLCIRRSVAVKEYLEGGMTSRILGLKTRNAEPMIELYELISRSQAYRSLRHRLQARVLRIRYALHARRSLLTYWTDLFFLPMGAGLYVGDRLRLGVRRK